MFQLIEQLHIISTKKPQAGPFSCFLRLNSLDMKLVTIQLNPLTQKLQPSTKSLLLLEKSPSLASLVLLTFTHNLTKTTHYSQTILRAFT